MEDRIIIAMIGHTAAGKTTLAKYLSQKLCVPYISEGEYKRNLKSKYSSENSMDEDLRDKGYTLAINHCIELLKQNNLVIIDASFHKLIRRIWLYEAIKDIKCATIIWLHCDCPDVGEVRMRLKGRAQAKDKNADNQADQFYIYEYIKATFERLDITDFSPTIGTAIIGINTADNILTHYHYNEFCNQVLLNELIGAILPKYLHAKQSSGGKNG